MGEGVAVGRGVAAVVGVDRATVAVPAGSPSPSRAQAANRANRIRRAHNVMGRKLIAKSLSCVRTGVDCSCYSLSGYSTLPLLRSALVVEGESVIWLADLRRGKIRSLFSP